MRKLSTFAKLVCENARMTNWDDFRVFLAVARAGNVTAAALQLQVNHSTVSRRISAMEERHGVRLFERLPTGYELTDAGDSIYPLALDIEEKSQQAERLLFARDSRLQGRLNLTMPYDVANFCIMPFFKSFLQQYPKIDVNFLVRPGLKNLNAREADIAIRLTDSPPDYLVGTKLANLRHGVYQSTQYCPEPGEKERVILWAFDVERPEWVRQHYPNAEVVLRVDGLIPMYAAVKAGIGVARMPCYVADSLNEKSVHRLDLALTPSTWGVWMLNHVDLLGTQRVKVCKDFLRELILKQKPLFEGELSHYLPAHK